MTGRSDLKDRHGRRLGALRISVTDRCNLRCSYCMPAASYNWLPQESLLSFEEIETLARSFVSAGVNKLRVTGGEPLLRPGVVDLVARLARIEGVVDLALTTNGTRLADSAEALKEAGLDRVTLSLDTLDPDKMKVATRHDRHSSVIAGIDAAVGSGFNNLKMNTVVMRGFNDSELPELVAFAVERGIEPRFIEYMDVGGALDWNADAVVSQEEILQLLSPAFGEPTKLGRGDDPSAPAARWRFPSGAVVGIVASTTKPFCGECDRSRLTADGVWYKCLYAPTGVALGQLLRKTQSAEQVGETIRAGWHQRDDRGAEQRSQVEERGALVPLTRLRSDPRLEMHVRGG